MIDFQSLSITLAALSFVVAASYYAMNLREIRRSRRITLSTTVLEPFMTVEGNQIVMELQTMTWNNLDDFMKKYDHRVNLESYAKRASMWNRCNAIGSLYREGLLDLKTLYAVSAGIITRMWLKFKPIIEMYRKTDYEPRAYEDWEYLAERLGEFTQSRGEVSRRVHELRESPGTTI